MKKLTAVALASVLATGAGAARAQSSVTLYGRIDAGVEYMTGVPTGQNPVTGAATGSSHRFKAESETGGRVSGASRAWRILAPAPRQYSTWKARSHHDGSRPFERRLVRPVCHGGNC